tara:strand:- start:21 stop:752 length:732 start_codon:yes stop_codon:yes gene_type:complete
MTKPILEQKKEKIMIIRSISFDLDDTLWPLMPTILEAEKNSRDWIEKNYPGAISCLSREISMEIRDKLLREDPSMINRLSEMREKIFLEAGIRSGYSHEESSIMANEAFRIFFEGRNKVNFYEGVIETLDLLKSNYSLGVITNGNADLEMIGISDYFDYILTPAELNTHKPDPLMFEAAVKATGLKAGEICHVGDHPINDVKASYEFGNKSIWFKENGKELDLDIEVPYFSHWRDLPGLLENI